MSRGTPRLLFLQVSTFLTAPDIPGFRSYGPRSDMIPSQITLPPALVGFSQHPSRTSSKVKLPSAISSSTLFFKSRPINQELLDGLPRVKSDSAAVGNYATNDLVDILASPGCASQNTSSWSSAPLSPLRVVTYWFKHMLWIFSRPVTWHYPTLSHGNILDSDTLEIACNKAMQQEASAVAPAAFINHEPSIYLREAQEILNQMASSISVLLIRVAAVVVNKIFRHSLSGIYVRRRPLSELQSLEEANPGTPLVYLPLHRSHLDYILLTYLLYIRGMRAPQVAAGDNLNIPVFGCLLRGLGGFFIRRKIDHSKKSEFRTGFEGRDFIYRGVLQQFICEALSRGYPLEFYLEGGRSRNGRTLQAKAGLLSVLIHAYQRGFIKDAIIVPVAFTYDRLIEGNFVAEQCGSQKTKESFMHALRSIWRTITAHFGSVRIEFGQPFNLKHFLHVNSERFGLDLEKDFELSGCPARGEQSLALHSSSSTASLMSVSTSDESGISRLTLELASNVLRAANQCLALSAPNIVCFLMATKFREGCEESDLLSAMYDLCDGLTSPSKQKMLTFEDLSRENLRQLCRYAASVLSHLISYSDGRYYICLTTEKMIELHYYGGPVMEALVGESFLAASLSVELQRVNVSLISRNGFDQMEIDWRAAEKRAYDLRAILEMEFIQLQTPESTESVIKEAIRCLAEWEILKTGRAPNSQEERVYVRCEQRTLRKISDFQASIAPLIEGYSAVVNELAQIIDSVHNICDRCLQREVLLGIHLKVNAGSVRYPEGCAKDTMLNCFKVLRKLGILETRSSTSITSLGHQKRQNAPIDEICGSKFCETQISSMPTQLNQISMTGAEGLASLARTLEMFKAPLIIV